MPAPAWRRTVAIVIDLALHFSLAWGLRLARGLPAGWRDAVTGAEPRWMKLVGQSSDLVREQIGSPGQRAVGIRTVDRRTGERVAVWRSLLLTAIRLAIGAFATRRARAASSPERMRERERYMAEWRAIRERHSDDPDAREAARRELVAPHDIASSCAPVLALGLLSTLLRRRLAPTTDVSVRDRA